MTIAVDVAEEVVDVRCPVPQVWHDGTCKPGRLLLRLRQSGEKPSYVHPDNLIELACEDCKTALRKAGRRGVKRVLHRYNFLGDLVETLVEETA